MQKLSKGQSTFLVLLRIAIGWHFLYEGLVKLLMGNWTAAEYLSVSNWIFAPFFHWIAETPAVLSVVDALNIWGLILIGLALMFGLVERFAAILAMVLLSLYYLANPPFVGLEFGVPTEGHYLVVNKNLVEFFALGVLAIFPTSKIFGLDYFIKRKPKPAKKQVDMDIKHPQEPMSVGRRQAIKALTGIPAAGAFAVAFARKKQWQSWEEQNLVDAMTSPSTKLFNPAGLAELKGEIPKAKVKDVEFSRLILGGNLLSGYSHSRDLIYVSNLVKAYHNKDKIFATLLTAEKCGINTLLTNPILATIIDEYWKRKIGNIQFISDCAGLNYDKGVYAVSFEEYIGRIQRAIDYGATSCYIQGETADYYIENGLIDQLAKAIELVQNNNLPVGIGAHRVETLEKCVELGLIPDYWMKTLHHHNYWSAQAETWHDNKYCFDPQRTIDFIASRPEPVIAFKTMAAGSIHPNDAFRYAFENGADFVCAGIYDFQMVEDCNIAHDVLNSKELALNRKRDWMAV